MEDLIKVIPDFLDKESCKTIIDSYGDPEIEKSSNPNLIDVTGFIKQAMLEKIVFYLKTYPNIRGLENVNTSEALRILHQTAYLFGEMEQKATVLNSTFDLKNIIVEDKDLNITRLDSGLIESERGYLDPNNSIEFLTFLGGDDTVLEFKKINDQFNLNTGDLLIFPSSWIFDYKISSQGESYFLTNTVAFDESKYQIIDF